MRGVARTGMVAATLLVGPRFAAQGDVATPPPSEVRLTVVSEDGRAVRGLQATDFRIELDGLPVVIERLAERSEQVAAVLLLDRSPSMGEVVVREDQERTAIEYGFFQSLRAGDLARVGTVRKTFTVGEVLPMTRKAFRRQVAQIYAEDDEARKRYRQTGEVDRFVTSPIWDAVGSAIKALAGSPGRRLIILVSDGEGTGNVLSPEEVAERATAGGVAVSVVHQGRAEIIPQDGNQKAFVRTDEQARAVAARTGGLYLPDASALGQPARFNAPAALVMRAIKTLRHVYSLRLAAPNDARDRLRIAVQREHSHLIAVR
jgi:hypothetical protein